MREHAHANDVHILQFFPYILLRTSKIYMYIYIYKDIHRCTESLYVCVCVACLYEWHTRVESITVRDRLVLREELVD